MDIERVDEERQEAVLQTARAEEALLDALRDKDGVQTALERLLEERKALRAELAKAVGERDFFEWQLLEREVGCVEWIVPPEELIEPVEETDPSGVTWRKNELFGTENALFE